MSTVASVRIESWGAKFVIVGEFSDMTVIPRQEFENYSDALHELAKVVQREEIRYATFIGRRLDR